MKTIHTLHIFEEANSTQNRGFLLRLTREINGYLFYKYRFFPSHLFHCQTSTQPRNSQEYSIPTMDKPFNPGRLTFEQGLRRIKDAAKKTQLDQTSEIVTSRDTRAAKAQSLLKVDNIPDGFVKWQLPVYLEKPSQLFITVAPPDADVPEHSHDEGDGIRFISAGSINYNGQELTAGDWMFIPKGKTYSFKVGTFGAMMCYCYCCCCA